MGMDTATSVCIVGAGVAGLTCASVLHGNGLSVRLLEAHNTVGGRVRSVTAEDGSHLGDLGPSWVWPPYQQRLAVWLEKLGVSTWPQYEQGDGCMDSKPGKAAERMLIPGQHGQHRPLGGPQAIVDSLQASLSEQIIQTGCRVLSIKQHNDGVTLITEQGDAIETEIVVLAVPLRIAIRDIRFDPPLTPAISRLCESAPTWMAAQAKALIVYDRPFWRDAGFSGRIASTLGPLVEAHDHSGPDGLPGALVGFVGLDTNSRHQVTHRHGEAALANAVIDQLVRCFGDQATTAQFVRIEDWACDPYVTTSLDIKTPGGHPAILPESLRQPLWDGQLHFAVSETANVSPGLLEGAFVAGEQTAREILANRSALDMQ